MNAEIIQIIKTLFGSTKVGFKTVSIFLLFALVTAWLPDGIIAILDGKFEFAPIVQVVSPLIILIGLWFWLRRVADSSELNVIVDDSPLPAKALILFLSSNKDEREFERVSSIEEIKSNWKQPLRSMYYHKEYLKTVFVLTSPSSYEQKESFEATVKKVIPNAVELNFANPVDFEDAKGIFESLKASYESLKANGFRKSEIYIDLTGGTKVATIAGAIFALPEDRVVQYVTNDGKVKLYDLEYRQEV